MINCHVIKNDYLCSDNIRFAMTKEEISPQIKGLLVKRFNLINESQVIEKIEKAILDYYEFPLLNIQKEEGWVYDAYVYIYADPTISGRWHLYGDEYIGNKPLYVGKGQGNRDTSHLVYTHNSELDMSITYLQREGLSPIIKLYNKGCTDAMAYNLENYIIARLREQGVNLCNATPQRNSSVYNKNIVVSTLNIEKLEANLILDALNDPMAKGRRKLASALLGISERSLYRKIKTLGIKKIMGFYTFNDNSSYFI